MNTVTVNRLFEFCGLYGTVPNPYLRDHLAELDALSIDRDLALALSCYAALVFIAMHEYAHVAAGHLAYDRETFGDGSGRAFSFTEREGRQDGAAPGPRDTETYRRFRRISELEADGVAFALTFEFAPEVAMLVGLDPVRAIAYGSGLSQVLENAA